jgi:hypothetical protein
MMSARACCATATALFDVISGALILNPIKTIIAFKQMIK